MVPAILNLQNKVAALEKEVEELKKKSHKPTPVCCWENEKDCSMHGKDLL